MANFFGADKVLRLLGWVQKNGGVFATIRKGWKMDEFKAGTLVGSDKYGNKYYEEPSQFYGRNRWVEYSPHRNFEYDGSQIPAEWYGWMHYKTDLPPHRDGNRPQYKWMSDHSENLSGTTDQYYPYSTTKPKVEGWDPKKSS